MALWSGRFVGKMDKNAWVFNASIGVDQRMAVEDVTGSEAWAQQLAAIGVLSDSELAQILGGLSAIKVEFEDGQFQYQPEDEDIHSAVERRLYELIGNTAGKLHSGRSRNDQVATDFRLWVLKHIPHIQIAIKQLQQVLLNRAESDFGIAMPAYTHLQLAQPVLLSHWWLSHFWALERDYQRWEMLLNSTSVLPLGSAAVAGTGFPMNRMALAESLGFNTISNNSIDAVSDRDFAAEFLFNASMTAIHLSKLSEVMVLYTSKEFGYFVLDDAFSTGSSLMPQKKNPDVFELARGKAGTMIGALTGLLTTLKGLPSTYDKDLQEDKAPVFTAYDYLILVLPVISGALETLTVNEKQMADAIDDSMFATDLADQLVLTGVPFREAHGIVAKAVRIAVEEEKGLSELSADELSAAGIQKELFSQDVFSVEASLNKKNVPGGTGFQAVKDQIQHARRCVENKLN